MKSAGHVARIGTKRHTDRFNLDNPKERGRFKYISIGGRTILKWIPRKQNGIVETELVRLRYG